MSYPAEKALMNLESALNDITSAIAQHQGNVSLLSSAATHATEALIDVEGWLTLQRLDAAQSFYPPDEDE